jgi:hypothetical protein
MHPVFLATGLCWAAAYVLIIRQGFADRTYGMPIVALCANLSWEFIFSVVRPVEADAQRIGNFLWLAFDVVILYTFLRFGPREFPKLSKPVFYGGFAGTLVLSYLAVDLMCREFENGAGNYAGFADNLMMSGLFVAMVLSRGDLRGQSVAIAALKFVGTICASVGYWQYGRTNPHSALFMYLYFGNGILDFVYLSAVVYLRTRIRNRAGAVPAQRAAQTVAQPTT